MAKVSFHQCSPLDRICLLLFSSEKCGSAKTVNNKLRIIMKTPLLKLCLAVYAAVCLTVAYPNVLMAQSGCPDAFACSAYWYAPCPTSCTYYTTTDLNGNPVARLCGYCPGANTTC